MPSSVVLKSVGIRVLPPSVGVLEIWWLISQIEVLFTFLRNAVQSSLLVCSRCRVYSERNSWNSLWIGLAVSKRFLYDLVQSQLSYFLAIAHSLFHHRFSLGKGFDNGTCSSAVFDIASIRFSSFELSSLMDQIFFSLPNTSRWFRSDLLKTSQSTFQ